MSERNEDMDFKSDLTEELKTFVDDMLDYRIVNITKSHIPESLKIHYLTDKHGNNIGINYERMRQVKNYCLWLIEIGAVKIREGNSILPSYNPVS